MCDGEIEADLWEALLTAGACWRAARAEPREATHWEMVAAAFSYEATVLLDYDASSWS